MKVKTDELKRALEVVKPGLASKELIQQSTHFAFMDNKIITYNDEVSVSHPYAFEEIRLEGAVNATEFYSFLKKVGKPEIEVEDTENEVLFKSGRAKAGFKKQSEILLPLEQIDRRSDWMELPSKFCEYLSLAMGAAGQDMSRPVLTCVYVRKQGTLTASDSFKVMHCVLDEEMPVDTFLIPAQSALHVVRMEPTQIAEGKGWIHFKTEEGTIMSCRTLEEDEYPYEKVRGFLEVDGTAFSLPKAIQELIDKASVFSKRDHPLEERVTITIENRKITVTASSDTGWSTEDANIRYDGPKVTFSIPPYLLRDILEDTQEMVLGDNLIKFEVDEHWTYVAILSE